jgi:hypothetical protein
VRTGPALAGFLLLAGPAPVGSALGQPAPRVLPSRDVVLVYQVGGAARDAIPGGIPGAVRIAWSARLQSLRVEPEGRSQALLLDLAGPPGRQRVEIVDSGLRTAMSLHVRNKDLEPLTLQDARLTRRGQSTVAGQSCTDYAVEARRGHGTLCLTEDGVTLRADGEVDGRKGRFTAVSVSYGTLPPGLFKVPPGYMQLALPEVSRH